MVFADTLPGALVEAYANNPQLNAQRASTRATDENVPQALSGYRPTISATAATGVRHTDTLVPGLPGRGDIRTRNTFSPRGIGITGTQTLFNGFRTANNTRLAEAQVFAARETLRVVEQTTLLNAATAYMNVLQNAAIVQVQQSNVTVLEAQLRQTNDRFNVGEVTKTDVAQAESQLAAGRSSLLQAQQNLLASKATYRQIIGSDPRNLAAGMAVDRFLPKSQNQAIAIALAGHPSVTSAMYNVDAALFQVKVAESGLSPTVTVQGTVQKDWRPSASVLDQYSASVFGTLNVPIYQGGTEYSQIREAKETLSQQRLNLDNQRAAIRAGVVQAYGQLESAKAQVIANQSAVASAEVALNGVREEARVGQRTTYDVLQAQQTLVTARVNLVTSQATRVIASYTALSSVGRLSPQVIGLKVSIYNPAEHYYQVRDSWFGVRTPDGK
jgi:outer membrane protein